MCFSATVSYGAATMLVSTGLYASVSARHLSLAYRLFALTPFLFGIQQAMEGRVWQMLDAGQAGNAVPYALGFHFFSHFLWLWWFPLCSYLLETGTRRRWLFLGLGVLGGIAGGVVFFAVLLHPEWMVVSVKHYSIVYDIESPVRGSFSIPFPASAVYALIVLVPLLYSSHPRLRVFGVLVLLSVVLASVAYGYAFVSVWCFFVALLSLYLAYLIKQARPDRIA